MKAIQFTGKFMYSEAKDFDLALLERKILAKAANCKHTNVSSEAAYY